MKTATKRRTHVWCLGLLMSLTACLLLPACTSTRQETASVVVRQSSTAKIEQPSQARLRAAYLGLPLSFEANNGQTDPQVKFRSRGRGYTLFLTPTEAVLTLQTDESRGRIGGAGQASPPVQSAKTSGETLGWRGRNTVLRMKLAGANPNPRVTGMEELPGKANYFIGNDPQKWRTNVPTFAKVKYHEVYPGVDLVYHGKEGQLEYDFVVAPGADPRIIKLTFDGADKVETDARGDLVLYAAAGEIRHHKPRIYQDVDGVRREITGGYALEDAHRVGFTVGSYDTTKTLIVDPTLSYSTYLGGSGDEGADDIAVDSAGRVYVTGSTRSTDFPANNANHGGFRDIFVTKLDPSQAGGASFVFSMYLGGSQGVGFSAGDEFGPHIALQETASGVFVYVTGQTASSDFPTTANAFQRNLGGIAGNNDAFVTKISPNGAALTYSTYLGGQGIDEGNGIDVDSAGNAYVTGETFSELFPLKNAFQTINLFNRDAFVTKLNSSGSGLLYSTFLGGDKFDQGNGIDALDSGVVFVTGQTLSQRFPLRSPSSLSPLQGPQGSQDAFVAKLDTTRSGDASLVYSTYLGGSNTDIAEDIAVDSNGRAYITGTTFSADTFPIVVPIGGTFGMTAGGSCPEPFSSDDGCDAFVAKLNADGTALFYSLFLGGTGPDRGVGIVIDSLGNAYLTGRTHSTDFPRVNALQPVLRGSADAFVTVVNAVGTNLLFSTYLGGDSVDGGFDGGNAIAVQEVTESFLGGKRRVRHAFVTGFVNATNFPTANPFQASLAGDSDAFVTKIGAITGAGLSGTWVELTQRCSGAGPACLLKGILNVRNVGTDDAPNSVVQFYLSTDAALDESDQLLHEVAVGSLPAGGVKRRTFSSELSGSASGLFVIAVVDANDDVEEPNEVNNVVVSPPIP